MHRPRPAYAYFDETSASIVNQIKVVQLSHFIKWAIIANNSHLPSLTCGWKEINFVGFGVLTDIMNASGIQRRLKRKNVKLSL
jgi:hypothetical protein